MSAPKFTPGPWEVRVWDGDHWPIWRTSIAEKNGKGHALFISAKHAPNVPANAHLIAAAPDLYEALCDMVSDRECLSEATIDFAKRALAKARGES